MMRKTVVGAILTLALATGCSSGRTQDRVVVTPRAVRYDAHRDIIVVERTHVPRGQAHGWWKKHGYREVTVYYDGDRYYSRRVEPKGFQAVVVYQREGKYYMADADGDDRDRNDQGHGHGRKHDKGKDD
jgi:hypothetical protein